MNKTEFLEKLQYKLNCDKEKAIIINDTLENNFFLSKKNTPKIINDLMNILEITEEEATKIFEEAKSIIKSEIKEKIKYPFRNKD